jgi:hypothetical protein
MSVAVVCVCVCVCVYAVGYSKLLVCVLVRFLALCPHCLDFLTCILNTYTNKDNIKVLCYYTAMLYQGLIMNI